MQHKFNLPGMVTDSIDTPYVVSVEDIQQNMQNSKRVDRVKLLIMSMNVPLLTLITFSFAFSFLHFIAIIS